MYFMRYNMLLQTNNRDKYMDINLKRFNYLVKVNKDKFPMLPKQIIELVKGYGHSINSNDLKQQLSQKECLIIRVPYKNIYDLKSRLDLKNRAPYESGYKNKATDWLKCGYSKQDSVIKKPETAYPRTYIYGTPENRTQMNISFSGEDIHLQNLVLAKVQETIKDIMNTQKGILVLNINKED